MTEPVRIERSITAPITTVWQMWTDPDRFASWYGPMGATVPVARFDLHVGGRRFVEMQMTTPRGPMTMWFTGEFRVLDEPHRLVHSELMCDESGSPVAGPDGDIVETEVEVTLKATGDATTFVLTHHGVPADSPGAMGWAMALDQLVEQLTG